MRLVVCGNGFDLHHGLNTSYKNYRDYLLSQNIQAVKQFETLTEQVTETSPWNNIEASLGINYSKYVEDLMNEYLKDSNICLDAVCEDELRFLFSFTGEYFARWLGTIDVTVASRDFSIGLLQDDLYVTFNYTDTLQQVYDIPEDNIIFLHGKLKDIDACAFGIRDIFPSIPLEAIVQGTDPVVYGDKVSNDIIHCAIQFGADAKEVSKMFELVRKKINKQGDQPITLIQKIDDIISATTKDVRLNFEKLKRFLSDKNIDDVVVMGHSLDGPDFMYYENVMIPCLKKSEWTVMRHRDSEKGIDSDFENRIASLEKLLGKNVIVVDW